MRLLWSVCFLFVLVPHSNAQELKDLRQVQIIIENLKSERSKAIGLSEETLEAQTLVALKRDMPRLEVNKTAASYIYVNIIAAESRAEYVAVCLSIEVKRPVKIMGDDYHSEIGSTLATVWDTAFLLGGGKEDMASRIREKISNLITDLAAAYYRENPR